VASVVFLAAFLVWESRQDEPLLPLSLFRDRNFSIGNLAVAMITFGLVGQMVVLLIFLQSDLGLSAVQSGIAVVPNALMVMAGAPLGGKLSQRINGKYLIFAGLLLYALGVLAIRVAAAFTATGLTFTSPLMMTGFGMGLTISPMATMALEYVAPSAAGAASGFINTVREVGAALGAAVVGAVLQGRLATELPAQAAKLSPFLLTQYPGHYRAVFVQVFQTVAKGGPSPTPCARSRRWSSAVPIWNR
jgi:MFS family permease